MLIKKEAVYLYIRIFVIYYFLSSLFGANIKSIKEEFLSLSILHMTLEKRCMDVETTFYGR